MPINVPCACGESIPAEAEMAGKRLTCTRCGRIVIFRFKTEASRGGAPKGWASRRNGILAASAVLVLAVTGALVSVITAAWTGPRAAPPPVERTSSKATGTNTLSTEATLIAHVSEPTRERASEPTTEPAGEPTPDPAPARGALAGALDPATEPLPEQGDGSDQPPSESALKWLAATRAGVSANPDAPAEFTVTNEVIRPAAEVPPLGNNDWGGSGTVEWAANNFVNNPGNEPIHWQNMHRITKCGPNWFEIDGPGTSWWGLWNSGFLSGARLRIYRLVNSQDQPLPRKGDYLDIDRADHVRMVGTTTVLPEGSPGFPDGGWIANMYAPPTPNGLIRHGNLQVTDITGLESGRPYWYVVVAIGADGQESVPSDEVTAEPTDGNDTPPRILIIKDGDDTPPLKRGGRFDFQPRLYGGRGPYRWALETTEGRVRTPPPGLRFDAAKGQLSGTPTADPGELRLRFEVADARGRRAHRDFVFNPATRSATGKLPKPEPPRNVTAVGGVGCVTLSWDPSPTADLKGYRLKRSTAPAKSQVQRVYVDSSSPKLEPWDYVAIDKRFDRFNMSYVSPRIRGVGGQVNQPGWYWGEANGDPSGLAFSIVPHPKPLPADFRDPGEGCMRIQASAGEHNIYQKVFIGTGRGKESVWYGLLEPDKHYRLEVWLRQEGLAHDGAVTFSYGKGYPQIRGDFRVTRQWKKYIYDFVGPPRPVEAPHFGHTISFAGPGVLWMDNCRIFRMDRQADADRPYVPNATVLKELVLSQPASGPKGAHRIWFLMRDATMSSLLSWYSSTRVRVDWNTGVTGTTRMTIPMGLSFDLRTGDSAETRMRPWLVLQHLLHDEQDWLNLIEYLAAPFDPRSDSEETKPWAYKRYQQRGNGTPWIDEFQSLTIEFGNETWHNGVFDDWLGFRMHGAVMQGGQEYGFFCRYLIDNMKRSPYWKSQHLDRKIQFALGANYDGKIDSKGNVTGYGELAMKACGAATKLSHANYVGPKWETREKALARLDDHGFQETLIGSLTGPRTNGIHMMEARNALARLNHRYELTAYEGGPSGYAIPGRDAPEQQAVSEGYGKSLAMGVAALDTWLGAYGYGWTDQCFLGYLQGDKWSSHTPLWDGFRPSPAWMALALRNRHARGDFMAVTELSVPTVARQSKTATEIYPLVTAYAMRDGDRWSLFVLSRKLNGRYDDTDLGAGVTPVTVHLPFARASQITLHTLTGDPRGTNQKSLTIKPEAYRIDTRALSGGTLRINEQTGGGSSGMPPGSVFLYVFEGTSTS